MKGRAMKIKNQRVMIRDGVNDLKLTFVKVKGGIGITRKIR